MKASKVLLRWYKSFNVNYTQYADYGVKTVARPWNTLLLPDATESDLPFIEITLERDVTTVVGANESGKSHLLSAISKVVTGKGLEEIDRKARSFSRTDLCHYSSIRSKNADAWPNIGLEFSDLTADDATRLGAAITNRSWQPKEGGRFTLILAPSSKNTEDVAYLYPENSEPFIALDEKQLTQTRQCLPQIRFIQSKAELSDDIHIADVLSHFGVTSAQRRPYFPLQALMQAVEAVMGINPGGNNQLSNENAELLSSTKSLLSAGQTKLISGKLEAELFKVLGIDGSAIEFLAGLEDEDRSYAESLVETWNDEIDRILNLSHYWQQDDQFRIRMNYKRGSIYFEITDKTNAVYTFRERSSGLRYFLSYYIQAKAIQLTTKDQNCIILMDEPDSFLSIAGQRNLLAVFESLVNADSSLENAQLLYTTHSPFLINRNFPRRIRLVRKGDAEEGTQFVGASHVRRYEPIRSALGIDCAQTLFMGATNVIVEGTTDQYLICELVRHFATPENIGQLIDLNAVVLTSADGAGGPEQLLGSSQWGDEPRPATLVLFDDDAAGHRGRDRITGAENGFKQLVPPEFALLISTVVPHEEDGQQIVSTEDLLPARLYADAVRRYIKRWHGDDIPQQVESLLASGTFGESGVVESTRAAFTELLGEVTEGYDKMGVLREAVALLKESTTAVHSETLRQRFFGFCKVMRESTEACEHAQQVRTGKQAIKRIIREFFIIHKESSTLFDVGVIINRIERETILLGEDGESLTHALRAWREEIQKMRAADQQRLTGKVWIEWKQRLEAVKRDPLHVSASPLNEGNSPEAIASVPESQTPIEREVAEVKP